MYILAKSTGFYHQMEDKKKKGAKYLELHLTEEQIDNKDKRNLIVKNMIDLDLEIKVCHTPISSKYQLEGVLNEINFKIIEDTFKLAEEISHITKETIDVVLHHSLNLKQLKEWGVYNTIMNKVAYLLYKYPNTRINLENLMVVLLDDNAFEACPNFSFQNIELCKELREDVKTDKIGTVLDTCHAISTIKILKEFKDRKIIDFNLKDFFVKNKEYLNVIHLANAVDLGFDSEEVMMHGVGFDTDEDIKLLRNMFDYIKEINYNKIITLEVQEKDYLNSITYEKLKNQIDHILHS